MSKHEAVDALVLTAPGAQRPVLGYKANGIWIFTLHSNASSKAASAAKGLIKAVQDKVGNEDWIIAGDINCQTIDVQGEFDVRRTDPKGCRRKADYSECAFQDLEWIVQKKRSPCQQRLSLHQGRSLTTANLFLSDHPAQLFQIWSTKSTMEKD